jgi:hypothetical protein
MLIRPLFVQMPEFLPGTRYRHPLLYDIYGLHAKIHSYHHYSDLGMVLSRCNPGCERCTPNPIHLLQYGTRMHLLSEFALPNRQ